MKKLFIVLLGVSLSGTAAMADHVQDRLDSLEKKQAELYHTLAQKKETGLDTKISEKLSLGGLIELEATYTDVDYDSVSDEKSTDLVVATAQLEIGAEVTDRIEAAMLLLYEEDENDGRVVIDEAFATYTYSRYQADIGLVYLPFGAYPSHFLSGPMTSDLGEAQETALVLTGETDIVSVTGFVFNGDVDKEGSDDHLNDFGLAATYVREGLVEVGVSYISDLADSDAEITDGTDYREQVGGLAAHVVASFGQIELIGEVVTAIGEFDNVDNDGDSDGDQPMAWNFEFSYDAAENFEVAARIEGSDEFAGMPELQYGVCASWGAFDNVTVALELLQGLYDDDFGYDEDGNVIDSVTSVTAQLAMEF